MIASYDLHNHTDRSKDGGAPGEALLRLAARRGLAGIGVCDHDVFADASLRETAARGNVALALGVEFTCDKAHVIGFNLNPGEADRAFLERRFAALAESAAEVTRYILAKLARRGIVVEYEALRAFAGKTPQKLFLLKYLSREMGLFPGWAEARRHLLREGLYVSDDAGLEKLHPAEMVALIRRGGGAAVWAHPFLTPEPLRRGYFEDMRDAGLHALETAYAYRENGYRGPETDSDLARAARSMAREAGLWASGGSDSHYPVKTAACGRPILPGDVGLNELDPEFMERLFGGEAVAQKVRDRAA